MDQKGYETIILDHDCDLWVTGVRWVEWMHRIRTYLVFIDGSAVANK